MSDWIVEDGKLIQEMPEAQLDRKIERISERILTMTDRIQELKDARTKLQANLNKATQLKEALNS
jgi:prefoldin subunit 5